MTQPHLHPSSPRPAHVRFFRDARGTLFAAEIVERDRWDAALCARPSVDVADVRIAFLAGGEAPRQVPGWLGICTGSPPPDDPLWLVELARRAWLASPTHREPGAPPEAYVHAAFTALCPPHPPCPAHPGARESVIAFARGRPGAVGRLAEFGRDGFDRWLHICWPTPEALARAVLLERMSDDGARRQVVAIHRLEAAEVEPGSEFAALAVERTALLARLDPAAYFERIPAFNEAVAEAEAWWKRYAEAYAAHCRRLSAMAAKLPSELLAAISAMELLRSLNDTPWRGTPVGEEALHRLEEAVHAIRAIRPDPDDVPTPGIVLGRVPAAFAEARLAAAAVLAAVDVQRRRVSR